MMPSRSPGEEVGRTVEATSLHSAISFAVAAHRHQLRKDGRTPYIVHPIGVLRILRSDLGIEDDVLARAAVLHDVVEDTTASLSEVATLFGPEVASVVEELTIPPEFHGPNVPSARKTERIVSDLGRVSWGAVVVKLCDRQDNLRDMGNTRWTDRQKRDYRDQTRRMVAAVRDRLGRSSPPPLLEAAIARALTLLEEAAPLLPPG